MLTTAKWIDILTPNGSMEAYLVHPVNSQKPLPAVLVFMEIFGVNHHIREVSARLAAEGYVTLAINYYHRSTKNLELGYTEATMAEGRQHKSATTTQGLLTDIQAGMAYLTTLPFVKRGSMGCIGFCFGGYVAYLASTLPQIAATASFYGAGIGDIENPDAPIHLTKAIQGEMLCLFGETDPLIPTVQMDNVELALQTHHIRHQVVRYPKAGHGFFCNEREDFNAQAAEDAWLKVKQLFASTL